MPSSKILGHPDYDDRIQKILQSAFGTFAADIRPLLEQTASIAADHESTERLAYAELRAITRINEAHAAQEPV
jgi:hypothetical protein